MLSEFGPDLSRFPSVKHFCSCLGLWPGKVLSSRTRRSKNWMRPGLKLATMSLSGSGSALGAFYRGTCARKDDPDANTGTAHKLTRMVYFMLPREDFVDHGQHRNEEQQRQPTWLRLNFVPQPLVSSSPDRNFHLNAVFNTVRRCVWTFDTVCAGRGLCNCRRCRFRLFLLVGRDVLLFALDRLLVVINLFRILGLSRH